MKRTFFLFLLSITGLSFLSAQTTPGPREGHSLVYSNGNLYLFGGITTESTQQSSLALKSVAGTGVPKNDLHKYCEGSALFEEVPATDIPETRTDQTATILPDGRMSVLFGNPGDGGDYLRDGYIFNPATNQWEELNFSGPVPNNRARHCAAVIGNNLYIFGGLTRYTSDGITYSNYSNDLFFLDITTNTWNYIPVMGNSVPPPTYGAGMVAYNGKLYIFGGKTQTGGETSYSNKAYEYNPETEQYTELSSLPGAGRYKVQATVNEEKGEITLWGGGTASERFNECWIYNVLKGDWSQGTIPDEVDLFASKAATDRQGTSWFYGGQDETYALKDDFYKVESQGEETEEWYKYNWETVEWQKIGGEYPTLTLGKSAVQYEPICPYCENCPSSGTPTETTIANLSISVDDMDGWKVTSIGFNAWGSGKDDQYIKEARLYVNGGLSSTATYISDNGVLSLPIGKHLQPGETITLKLCYLFDFPDQHTSEHYGEFGVTTSVALVSAEPDTYTQYKKLPTTNFSCGPQLVAPVKNINTEEYFATIQEGINSENTKDGHTIVVCPGYYSENVTLSKSLTINSKEGREATYILAANPDIPTISILKSNSSVRGFSIWNAFNSIGLLIQDVGNCSAYACKIENNFNGLNLLNTNNSTFQDNIVNNNGTGIIVRGNSSENIIGGILNESGNTITNNTVDGIKLLGENVKNNTIKGNIIGGEIGTDEYNDNGIRLTEGTNNNTIGGLNTGEGNQLIYNYKNCIILEGAGTSYNKIISNSFGTNEQLGLLQPDQVGIYISDGASYNDIGTTDDTSGKNTFKYVYTSIIIDGKKNSTNGIKICNNTFGNSQLAILIHDGKYHTVYENEFENNKNDFITDGDYKMGNYTISYNSVIDGGGFFIGMSDSNKVFNNYFEDVSIAISLFNASDNEIYENDCYKCSTGISLHGAIPCGKNIVRDNKIRKSFYGIEVGSSSADGQPTNTDNQINNNEILENGIGIFTDKSVNNNFSNNKLLSNGVVEGYDPNRGTSLRYKGIICWYSEGDTFTSNVIESSEEEGIYIEGGGLHTISDNTISKNNSDGICLNRGSKMNTIEKNRIINNEGGGISLIYYSDNNKITDNTLTENKNFGVLLSSSEEEVKNNVIEDTEGVAIKIYGSDKCKITGNVCRKSTGVAGIIIGFQAKNNDIINNTVEENSGDGIYIMDDGYSWNGKSIGNVINYNNILSNSKYGIRLEKCKYTAVSSNKITGNCGGIKERNGCSENAFANNTISNSWCLGTGIHITGTSNSKITGNSITGDAGAAIHCENGANPLISKNQLTGNEGSGILCESGSVPIVVQNNIYGNSKFGIENTDSDVTIIANDNWLGDASGTTGQTSGNVTANSWKNGLINLVACTFIDTVYTTPGSRDSVYCSARKWNTPYDEVVDISIQATDPSWLIGETAYTLALSDSLGADTLIYFLPPESAADRASNKLFFTATSQSDPGQISTDSVVVMTYHPYLASMSVSPDSVSIVQGDSLYFYVEGSDQKEKPFAFDTEWTASSGTIDSTGYFKAENLQELVYITATDPDSQQSVTAIIQVATEAPVTDTIVVSPGSASLDPGETILFSAQGYDQYGMKTEPSVTWEATGGDIDASGYFVASDETGTFTVTASDTEGVYGQATVVVGDPKYSLTLTASPSEAANAGCSVSQSGSGSYEDGETVTLTATPSEGWTFSGWAGSVTSAENPATLVMDTNKEITGTFEINTGVKVSPKSFRFYPNPTTGRIRIDLPGNTKKYHLKILDITGSAVMEDKDFRENEINLSGLTGGVYLIWLQNNENVFTGRIVKK